MTKFNKRLFRLGCFAVTFIILLTASAILNIAYGLNVSKNNEFIGTTEPQPPTQPPTTTRPPRPPDPPTTESPTTTTQPPPTTRVPPTTQPPPATRPTTSTQPVTIPPEDFVPAQTTITTENTVVTTVTELPPRYTTGDDFYDIDDHDPPGDRGNPEDTTEPTLNDYGDPTKPNPPSGGNPPKTGDEADSRPWLIILAISAIILRYILFFKNNKSENKGENAT